MVDFRYGPVELYLIGFEGARPDGTAVGGAMANGRQRKAQEQRRVRGGEDRAARLTRPTPAAH